MFKKSNSTTLVIGPFPPPHHGFSVATEHLFKYISARVPATYINLESRARNRTAQILGNAYLSTFASIRIFAFALSGGRRVSIAVNGGNGLIFTLLLLTCCRFLRMQTTLHHHSYAYINDHTSLMTLLVRLSRKFTIHVFLSESMKGDFRKQYGAIRSEVVSNAYIIPFAPAAISPVGPFTMGLLSNLSAEKGLHRFLDISRALNDKEVAFSAWLAGPVTSEVDRRLIEEALEDIPNLSYFGPLYGDAKLDFLSGLDLFIFPTTYNNEAQPIVLYEAMALGVPVLSVDRGCICEQTDSCLKVFANIYDFDTHAVSFIEEIVRSGRDAIGPAKACARDKFLADAKHATETIIQLFDLDRLDGRNER